MDYNNFPRARGVAATDGGGSATLFSALTGGRWNVMNGTISFVNMVNSCTISLYELDSTDSARIVDFMSSATSGSFIFQAGPIGIAASVTSSRFVLITGAVTGTICAVFSGYYTGA